MGELDFPGSGIASKWGSQERNGDLCNGDAMGTMERDVMGCNQTYQNYGVVAYGLCFRYQKRLKTRTAKCTGTLPTLREMVFSLGECVRSRS